MAASPDDLRLIAALQAGDEAAFATLLQRYGRALQRFARMFVSTDAQAEDVVAEVWVAVLMGLERFEGRSSLQTSIFRIAANIGRTRGAPRVALGAAVERLGRGRRRRALRGRRTVRRRRVGEPGAAVGLDAAQIALDDEAGARIREEIDRLPEVQRAVITLRDIHGLGSDEVGEALGLSAGNQRVILHRARSRVRAALESYFEPA